MEIGVMIRVTIRDTTRVMTRVAIGSARARVRAEPAMAAKSESGGTRRRATSSTRTTAAAVRRRMRELRDPADAKNLAWFFKTGPGEYGEGDRFLGLRVPALRGLVKEFRSLPLEQTLDLLDSPWHEERSLALFLLVRMYEKGNEKVREAVFRSYLECLHCVNNWDLVDASAAPIVGRHLRDRDRSLLRTLARAPSLWERRVAIIATYHYIREDEFRDTLAIAAMLLEDREDLIHKAVGWMLREVGKRDIEAEKRFLDRHAAVMPRTMLRYAIEKLPPAMRASYMAKGRGPGRP
jgi:3-methyladenine DNA glycosylase AlkD